MGMHKIYLPVTEQQFLSHFAKVKKNGDCNKNPNHLNYYKKSIKNNKDCPNKKDNRIGKSLKYLKKPCQIEKDERFWIASCMMTIYYSQNRTKELIHLLSNAYGILPPIKELKSWEECLDGDLHLFFEVNLPSPKLYKNWLSNHLTDRQLIPYVLDSAYNKINLEGSTNVDAVLLNSKNGFAIIIEAKVLSDISYEITYDTLRNQIARNIDVMLEKNERLCPPLDKRDPEKTLFLLITLKLFKDNLSSRLYGYKFHEYKTKPDSISIDLPHRKNYDWKSISDRLGWLTWKDFRNVNKNCCKWLNQSGL